MCGRFACTLDPEGVCQSVQLNSKDGKAIVPVWLPEPSIPEMHPSPNIAPTNYSPVLVSAKHFTAKVTGGSEIVVRPMKFGLVPSWHKGDEPKMDYATINCRVESALSKNTFAVPLKKGRRCVVLAEGFYEWKKPEPKSDTKQKQPYLVYLPENTDFFRVKHEQEEMKRKRTPAYLLKMAALFDVWKSPKMGDVYSYSILTVPASETTRWLHDRMPAILRTDDDVLKWLDFEKVPLNEAIKLVHPVNDLAWHPVTRAVGSVAFKDSSATQPVEIEKEEASGKRTPKKLPKGQKSLESFFGSDSKSKKRDADQEEQDEKPARKTSKKK